MKRTVLLSLLFGILPFVANAQDDMYFSPKKNKTENKLSAKQNDYSAYYGGSNRDVDEYNRRHLGSYYQNIGNDSTLDVIDFNGNTPDSIYIGKKGKRSYNQYDYDDDAYDYVYSRRMRWFDDFWYDDPWLYGYGYPYYGPYYGYYGYAWGRPWRYGYYGGWYDPWFYGYGGWYDPWFYGYGRPYWGPTISYRPYNKGGVSGTSNHGWVDNGRRNNSGNFGGYRGSNSTSSRNVDAYNRQNSSRNFSGYRGYNNNRNNSINERNNGFNNNVNREYNQSGFRNESTFNSNSMNRGNSNFGGGSFGGNRGGGFSGGGRSGGGGHFGGRR